MQTITDPPTPYLGPIKGGLNIGTLVRIQGYTPKTADRFNINLHCGPPPSDIALHISVRILQNYIARNNLENGSWGEEEGSGNLPITADQGFEILLLCDPDSYKIAINGHHFCEFKHRLPYRQVNTIEIDGDVSLKLISVEDVANPPPSVAPPPASAGPDFGYGPPPYNQYRGDGPPRPPGYEEESGMESFLETAGTVIAGALASGVAQNLLTNLTGTNAQQSSYEKFSTAASKPLLNQQPPLNTFGMPMPTSTHLPLSGMQLPTSRPLPPNSSFLPPHGMPLPTSTSLPPPGMPMPNSLPYHNPGALHSVPNYPSPGYASGLPVPPSSVYTNAYPSIGQPYPNNPYVYGHYDKKHDKKMKKKLKKAAKYGIPVAAVGVGAYAVSQALHKSSSSSSSSSDSD